MCLNEAYSKVRIGKHLSVKFPIQNSLHLQGRKSASEESAQREQVAACHPAGFQNSPFLTVTDC
jgi:hypothetical protein